MAPWNKVTFAVGDLMTRKNYVGDTGGTNYFCSIDGCDPKK